MATQAGDIFITGTIDDLCFYKMYGNYYVRMKSSLTGKRFWKDKSFEGSRKSCTRFEKGNKLASKIYQMIDEEKRVYRLYCFLKRRAILFLKEGKNIAEAEELLIDYLVEFGVIKRDEKAVVETNKDVMRRFAFGKEVSEVVFYCKVFNEAPD
jgi:hypothetical protein